MLPDKADKKARDRADRQDNCEHSWNLYGHKQWLCSKCGKRE